MELYLSSQDTSCGLIRKLILFPTLRDEAVLDKYCSQQGYHADRWDGLPSTQPEALAVGKSK